MRIHHKGHVMLARVRGRLLKLGSLVKNTVKQALRNLNPEYPYQIKYIDTRNASEPYIFTIKVKSQPSPKYMAAKEIVDTYKILSQFKPSEQEIIAQEYVRTQSLPRYYLFEIPINAVKQKYIIKLKEIGKGRILTASAKRLYSSREIVNSLSKEDLVQISYYAALEDIEFEHDAMRHFKRMKNQKSKIVELKPSDEP